MNNFLYYAGFIVFTFGFILAQPWFPITFPALASIKAEAVWVMVIGFVLVFITKKKSLRFIAALLFILGVCIQQDLLQLLGINFLKEYYLVMLGGGFGLLTFSE